eukprot:833727-Rhodomonas_salina.1
MQLGLGGARAGDLPTPVRVPALRGGGLSLRVQGRSRGRRKSWSGRTCGCTSPPTPPRSAPPKSSPRP